jgi:lipopolysaccharide transport system permease protein
MNRDQTDAIDMLEITLEAGRSEKNYLRDLWRYRELFYFLSWRDILVRYKQTVVGIAWAVLRPFLTMLVFTFIFNRIAKLHANGSAPYALLVMAGMLPWQFFANSLTESSTSLISNTNLISKVYFPRLIIPSSSVITSFIDFLITLVIMAFMMAWYRFAPDWHLLLLPLFVLLSFACAFGAGLWLAALNVEYRDFRYIIPFIVQFGLYLSPVGFSSSIVPAKWRLVYALNPCVGIIDGFRWSLLRGENPLWLPAVLLSVAITGVICLSSVWYFRRMEKSFADVI